MIPLPDISGLLPLAASSGSFLVSPALGLMIWTLIVFGVTMFVLGRAALPRIQAELEKRANAIRENIERAEQQRKEADELLADYRKRLAEARNQADEIVARSRKASEAASPRRRPRASPGARSWWRPRGATSSSRQALARQDPLGGRGPDGDRDREGDPQVARRR